MKKIIKVTCFLLALVFIFTGCVNSNKHNSAFERFMAEDYFSVMLYEEWPPIAKWYGAERPIVELPMGDKMSMVVGYIKESGSDKRLIALMPMRIIDGLYYLSYTQAYYKVSDFEKNELTRDDSTYFSIDFAMLDVGRPELEELDKDKYNFVSAQFVDTTGKKRDVVFYYTYEVNWEEGDGSPPDRMYS